MKKNISIKPYIAHSLEIWLPITMNWIYNQIYNMKDFNSMVLTHDIKNIEIFPWSEIYYNNGYLQQYLFRILRKLKIKNYPIIYDSAIKNNKPLILHSHFGDQGWRDIQIVKKHRLKHVVTFYGYDVNMLPKQQPDWRDKYIELFEKANLFLCEGPYMASCLVRMGCDRKKIVVQEIGVNVEKIPFIERKIDDNSNIKILIAATFREKKGIPYALEAIALLKKRYNKISITIIGDSVPGEINGEIEKQKIIEVIKRNNMENIVRMLSFQPHNILMMESYNHHIFLSPSITARNGDTEGGAPVTIIEMAASGIPVVSTKHCDIQNVLHDGFSGLLADERNVNELSNKIEILINDKDMYKNIALLARKQIEEKFDVVTQTRKIEKLYDSITLMH